MLANRALWGISLATLLTGFTIPANADTYKVIITGKVTMEDGTAPPFQVGIERVCSDIQGSAPGPITNKKGEYIWNMEMDAFASRSCWIRASHTGYVSTSQNISDINVTSHDPTHTLPTLVLTKSVPEPYAIVVSSENIPTHAKSAFNAAMKDLDNGKFPDAGAQLETAVKNSPKFAEGWHALGVIDERINKLPEARDAYEHAVKISPKFLQPYVTLARVCLKTKDWDCASKAAADGIKMDLKKLYTDQLYLHQAVAQYQLKDLAGAESSVQEAIKLDPQHHQPREEYVLGRILEAKGDMNGAKEHMATYLKLQPAPPDLEYLKSHIDNLGRPEAASVDPPLEPL